MTDNCSSVSAYLYHHVRYVPRSSLKCFLFFRVFLPHTHTHTPTADFKPSESSLFSLTLSVSAPWSGSRADDLIDVTTAGCFLMDEAAQRWRLISLSIEAKQCLTECRNKLFETANHMFIRVLSRQCGKESIPIHLSRQGILRCLLPCTNHPAGSFHGSKCRPALPVARQQPGSTTPV